MEKFGADRNRVIVAYRAAVAAAVSLSSPKAWLRRIQSGTCAYVGLNSEVTVAHKSQGSCKPMYIKSSLFLSPHRVSHR